MEPKELLRALMERSGDNPNSLAAKLNQKTKQPQIYKFLEGIAKEPRRSTLQPVADHYGISVEAFYDPALATLVFAGLKSGKAQGTTALSTPSQTLNIEPSAASAVPSLAETLERLGQLLQQADASTRETAAALLASLARNPDNHTKVATALGALLGNGGGLQFETNHHAGLPPTTPKMPA